MTDCSGASIRCSSCSRRAPSCTRATTPPGTTGRVWWSTKRCRRRSSDQLDLLRYSQARRAMNAALERIDVAILSSDPITRDRLAALGRDVSYAVDRLPLAGQFTVECIGMRASSQKRWAEAGSELLKRSPPTRQPVRGRMRVARTRDSTTRRAVEGLLVNDGRAVQRKATLHWVLVQLASLSTVLQHDLDDGPWQAAKLAAEPYCNHSDTGAASVGARQPRRTVAPATRQSAPVSRRARGACAEGASPRRDRRSAISRHRWVPDQVEPPAVQALRRLVG